MNDIEIIFKLETLKSDTKKMSRIQEGMKDFKPSTTDKAEAVRLFKDELKRRLVEAGLKVK